MKTRTRTLISRAEQAVRDGKISRADYGKALRTEIEQEVREIIEERRKQAEKEMKTCSR